MQNNYPVDGGQPKKGGFLRPLGNNRVDPVMVK